MSRLWDWLPEHVFATCNPFPEHAEPTSGRRYQVVVVDDEGVHPAAEPDRGWQLLQEVLAEDQLLQVLELADAQGQLFNLEKAGLRGVKSLVSM
jgi:hypothetical protein